jgi:polyphosphate kinase 2 (PPK2 family)
MNISQTLKTAAPKATKTQIEDLKELKLEMLRIQQAAYISGERIVILFEGFDAAGKGSCIRHLTETLDPRSSHVVPIGAPSPDEVGQHYLQRFWARLPKPGHIVVFDRSWYGRVLVEKVEKLTPKDRLAQAYTEINQFEKMLKDDGITVLKFFLVVSKNVQLERFQERLTNPLKGWKISEDDIRNRKNWNAYVKASDEMVKRCPGWVVVASDSKPYARFRVLNFVCQKLSPIVKPVIKAHRKKELDALTKKLLTS